jgi:hypothetical protein
MVASFVLKYPSHSAPSDVACHNAGELLSSGLRTTRLVTRPEQPSQSMSVLEPTRLPPGSETIQGSGTAGRRAVARAHALIRFTP